MKTKTIKQMVWETLEKGERVTDTMVAKFYNGEPNFQTAEEYKRAYFRYKADKNFCENQGEIIGVSRGHRAYYVEFKYNMYKICKDYYNELAPRFKKDFSKHKYFFRGNELYNIKQIQSFVGHDLEANWKDKDNGNIEHLGRFYLKDLEIKDLTDN